MGLDAGQVRVRIIADTTALTAGLTKASGQMSAFGSKASAIGGGMTKFMTIPLVAVGAASVKMAADYQSSLTKIHALTGASTIQVAQWSAEIKRWAGVVGRSPKELAEGLYFIASSGLEGAAALNAMKLSSKAAALGMGETKTIADYATSAIGAYGEGNMTAARAIDVLVNAVKVGKGEPEAFAASLGTISGTAAALHISLEDVVGSMSAMSLKGLDVPETTTALNNLMLATVKGAKEGSRELDQYGLTFKEVRDSFAKNGVVETLKALDDAFDGNIEKMHAVFPEVRGLKAVLQLLQGDYSKTKSVIDEVRDSQGALNKAWAAGKDDPTLQFRRSLAELRVAGIQIGTELLPTVVSAAREVGKLLRAFNDLSDGTRSFIVKALGIAVIAGPVIKLTGLVMQLRAAYLTAAAAKVALDAGAVASGGAAASSVGATAAGGAAAAGTGVAATAGLFATLAAPAIAGAIAAVLIAKLPGADDFGTAYTKKVSDAGFNARDPNARKAYREQQAEAFRDANKTLNKPIITTLQVKAAKSNPAEFARVYADYQKIKQLSDKGFNLKVDPKHALVSLQSIQARLMSTGMTAEQATKLMERVFGKDVVAPLRKNMQTLQPAVSAAARKAEARIAQLRAVAAKPTKFGRGDVTGLLNDIGAVTSGLYNLASAGRTASQAVSNALARKGGGTGGGRLMASGGAFTVSRPTTFTAGDSGREIAAFIPLGQGRDAALSQLIAQLASAGIGRAQSAEPVVNHYHFDVVLPGGSALIGEARKVGEAIAPHVKRAFEAEEARRGRRR